MPCRTCLSRSATYTPGPLALFLSRRPSIVSSLHVSSTSVVNLNAIRTIDADIVCSRAKNHYPPGGGLDISDTATVASSHADSQLANFKAAFVPLNTKMENSMYFMWTVFKLVFSLLVAAAGPATRSRFFFALVFHRNAIYAITQALISLLSFSWLNYICPVTHTMHVFTCWTLPCTFSYCKS